MLDKLETGVSEHQQYSDHRQQCEDLLSSLTEKLSVLGSTSGDRITVSNKLQRLQVGGCISKVWGVFEW